MYSEDGPHGLATNASHNKGIWMLASIYHLLEADFSTLQNYDIAHLKTSITIYEWFQAARGKWRYWGRFQK